MKKIISLLLVVVCFAALASGCGLTGSNGKKLGIGEVIEAAERISSDSKKTKTDDDDDDSDRNSVASSETDEETEVDEDNKAVEETEDVVETANVAETNTVSDSALANTVTTAGLSCSKYSGNFSEYQKLSFSDASASSELVYKTTIFSAKYACDNNVLSSWQEGAAGDGIGEYLMLSFPKERSLCALDFRLGYCETSNSDGYYRNGRPKTIRLDFSDGQSVIASFEDVYANQAIVLSEPVKTSYVKLTIDSVYSGTVNADTVISDISAYGFGLDADKPLYADTIFLGTYEQDNNTANGKEPIEWIVLAVEEDKALVVSRYALDCKSYHTENIYTFWDTCFIRNWLNYDFFFSAFNSCEQRYILTTTVTTHPNYDQGIAGMPVYTDDKLFLLSLDEIDTYFSQYLSSATSATEYAKAQGSYDGKDSHNTWYWLRTCGNDLNKACAVNGDATLVKQGDFVSRKGSIRPAMWIYY